MSMSFWGGIVVLLVTGCLGWIVEKLLSTGEIEPMRTPWEEEK